MAVTSRQSYLPTFPSDYATGTGELLRSFQNITGYYRTFHGHVINRGLNPPLLEDTQGKQPVALEPISGQLNVFLLMSSSNSFFEM
jgi:hypothetical protein